jgi:CHAD domain-containing protein
LVRSKWIEVASAERSLTEIATKALRNRLKTVWYYAPLATYKFGDDIEYVHQLRVSTRRAQAAIQLFSDVLPKSEARWMKNRLRSIRKAAGDARDLDVLGERLSKVAKNKKNSGLRPIIKQVGGLRKKAQKPLIAAYKNAKRKGFKERSRVLAKTVQWQNEQREPTFAVAARTRLAPLVDEFFRAAEADLSDIEALHQMRISAKQLRYAMELLCCAFDDSFRTELYAAFEEVQEEIGQVNDHATAVAMFNGWIERSDDGRSRDALARLVAKEEEQLDAKCTMFRNWWSVARVEQLKEQFAKPLGVEVDPILKTMKRPATCTGITASPVASECLSMSARTRNE